MLELQEFSLTPAMQARLKERIGGILAQPDLDHLTPERRQEMDALARQAVEEALPREVLPVIGALLRREKVAPVIIHNLPEVAYDAGLEARIDADMEKKYAAPDRKARLDLQREARSPLHTVGYWVAQGLYGLCHLEPQKALMLVRNRGMKKPHQFHRDMHPVSVLACIKSECGAKTHFVDMRDVAGRLSEEQKARITLEVRGNAWKLQEPIVEGLGARFTLLDYERHIMPLEPARQPLDHVLRLAKTDAQGSVNTSTETVEAYRTALAQCSREVELKAGDLIIWDNARIYHSAAEGQEPQIVQPPDSKYTRAVIFSSAGTGGRY